jgi:hypothetical protein
LAWQQQRQHGKGQAQQQQHMREVTTGINHSSYKWPGWKVLLFPAKTLPAHLVQ